MNKVYDVICSLGGSCAVSFNLKHRGLRLVSLPFDWLFSVDSKPIQTMLDCFKNDFKDFMLRENLKELEGNERGCNSGHYQYKDLYTGFRIIHAFKKPISDVNGFKKVRGVFQKRIERLYYLLENGKDFLFVLDASFDADISALKNLTKVLKDKFGQDKNFDFVVLQFGSDEDGSYKDENITVYTIKRIMNLYDCNDETNYDWHFLDDVEISKKLLRKFVKPILIRKIKKGFAVNIFDLLPSIFGFRIYLFGLRLKFYIGKERF